MVFVNASPLPSQSPDRACSILQLCPRSLLPAPVLPLGLGASSLPARLQRRWTCVGAARARCQNWGGILAEASVRSAAAGSMVPPAACWTPRASGTAGWTRAAHDGQHATADGSSEGAAMPTQTGGCRDRCRDRHVNLSDAKQTFSLISLWCYIILISGLIMFLCHLQLHLGCIHYKFMAGPLTVYFIMH